MRAFFAGLLIFLSLICREIRADDFEFFEKKIRPVLVEHCYKCHSTAAEKLKGELFLDSEAGMLKGGESGAAIIPGDVEKSLLIKAVRYTDKDLQMPPEKAGGKLSAAQIADLEAWVKMGAPDPRVELVQSSKAKVQNQKSPYDFATARTNWAFQKPKVAKVPKVKNKKWAQSPIDNFILAKLEQKNISPAPPADKRTLIRRATFDLIGLPPTPKEISDFLNDPSTNAFTHVVERLLASPQYGARWARHWLDVVRYTDSLDSRVLGQESDSLDAWRYRDWVVDAFNRDLPYDKFIQQQIAGDLLAEKSGGEFDTNALIATGVYAIGNWGNGDADKEKILTDIVDDQIDVTGRAFLGLTLACARCHDHKFDPIPTADYYSLAGIFSSSHILSKLMPKGAGETLMRIPLLSKTETEHRKKREARLVELEKQIEKTSVEAVELLATNLIPQIPDYIFAAWEILDRSRRGDEADSSSDDHRLLTSAATQQNLHETVLRRWTEFLDDGYLGLFPNPLKDLSGNIGLLAWKNSKAEDTPAILYNSSEKEFAKIPPHHFALHPAPKTGVAVGWKSPIAGKVQIHARVVDADAACGDGIEWNVMRGAKQIASGAIANASSQTLDEQENLKSLEVARGEMIQLTILPKGDHVCDTTLLDLQIVELDGAKRVWNLTNEVATDFLKQNPRPDTFGNAAVWHFIDLANAPKSFGETNSPLAKIVSLLGQKSKNSNELAKVAGELQENLRAKTTPSLQEDLMTARGAFWSPIRTDEKLFSSETKSALGKLRTELAELKSNSPPPILFAHGLQEGGVPESSMAGIHDVNIQVRGRYDRLGESAPRKFPRILAGENQPAISDGSGRLQLANWIASAENPLTARVMVNRLWQHHFGEGIVRTPNNYGKLGEPPTHPELLDFLANEFVKSGWSIKAMHRAMMLSATYQQSSVVGQVSSLPAAKLPASRPTSARGQDARENAGWKPASLVDPDNRLFGRMNRHRLESEALRDSLLSIAGKLDLTLGGPSVRDFSTNRRTLYVTTIRSDRATYQFLFDAADPNAIVEKRTDSTVSPQALFLLNHPFVLAQTKALVERLKSETKTNREKISWLYENLYGRLPSAQEIEIGERVIAKSPAESDDKIEPAEFAWEKYCQVLLCANEFIYVD